MHQARAGQRTGLAADAALDAGWPQDFHVLLRFGIYMHVGWLRALVNG